MSGRGRGYQDSGGGRGRGRGGGGGGGEYRGDGGGARGGGGGYQNRGGGAGRGDGGYRGGGGQGGGGGYQDRGRGGQGGGYDRGGPPRGRGGRGGGTVTDSLYPLPFQMTPAILQEAPFGWHRGEPDDEGYPVPPPSKGPGTLAQRIISLTTNNLPLRHLDLPKQIFTYDIDIDLSPEDKAGKANRKKKGPPPGRKPPPRDESPQEGDKDPPKPKLWKKIVKTLWPVLQEGNGYPGTDFMKIIYAPHRLNLQPEYRVILSQVEDEGNLPTVYIVRITEAGRPIPASVLKQCISDMYRFFIVERNPIPPNFINIDRILNIALKTTLNLSMTPVGRMSFYKEPRNGEERHDLSGGVVNWTGFSTLLTMGWKPFVNVDIANTAFVKGQTVYAALRDAAAATYGSQATPDNARSYQIFDIKNVLKLLKGVMVEYQTKKANKLTGRITDIITKPPRENRFTGSDGKETDVEKYFKSQYGTTLKYPNGVCLQLRGKSVVPAELCIIRKGQAYNAKLSEAQTASMIKETAVPPADRLEMIKQHVREINFEQDPVLKTFGVTVDSNLHKLEARVLPPPTLVYGGSGTLQKWLTPPKEGVWGMPSLKFVKPAAAFKWGVINSDRIDGGPVFDFVQQMCDSAVHVGLDMGDGDTVMDNYITIRHPNEVLGALETFIKNGLQMAMVIVSRKDVQMYGAIKTASEITIGRASEEAKQPATPMILTQVVQAKNVKNGDPSTVQNLLYKINMKMNGTNYYMHANYTGKKELGPWMRIDLLRAPVLIVGADVTHPGPDSKFPSLAAVTGSLDRTGMPYQVHLQAQRRAEKGAAEVITGLTAIIQKFIQVFVMKTGHKPRKIIYYRDGVGDGQFGEVLQTEMMAIREGCMAIGSQNMFYEKCVMDKSLGENALQPGAYQPKITFVAVQKRHKVRFFPNNPGVDGVGRMQNAPPGTVVDTDIVKPTITDFYLLSHTGIQGTSRPTRYQVLWDDSDLTANDLEALSYYLCYMYCRCTRSVSYPAPTYYAHLGATRAKAYAELLDDEVLADINEVNIRIRRTMAFQQQFRMHFV